MLKHVKSIPTKPIALEGLLSHSTPGELKGW